MKTSAILCLALLISVGVLAQDKPTKADKKEAKREKINQMIRLEEEGESGFRKHSLFGFKFNTDGWGGSYEKGKIKSPYKTNIFQVEFNEKKHKKEDKQSRSDGNVIFGSPFIYGKQNNFYQLKLGIGQQIMIGGKGNKNGVAVYAIYAGGFSAGMLKPYYVDVQDPPNSGLVRQIKYTQQDSALFMGQDILGSSGLGKGWGEMKFRPGVHAKSALRFDWGRFNNTVSAVEAGFNVEYYFQDVEQMVGIEPNKLFFNGYLSFVFGSRK
ncbi:MAG TPA: hypothetical protein VFX73_03460 [Chitinophagaceae bacterium]|nr:hypothetical protein [Chitinophagaceae bacterium]